MKHNLNWSRLVSGFCMVIIFLLFTWAMLSFVDVIAHNLDSNPEYHPLNLFVKGLEWAGKYNH